ncbi:extensin [Streptomyces sp. SCSIO 30461]|uniref:extensin n=1 Tax=Streptomyces sp. SCSIO 30461 TaxID=3118085 RepID=UPI0030CFC877
MKQIPGQEAIALLRTMTRVLCAVAVLALVFTTVNVTRFATSRDVPLPIAVLLDPMIGTALAGVLYVDARLASWGIRPPAWSTALRWGAGCTAALMNSWTSLWPDGQIGWPRRADPAAVLLHLTPALLLIALTETIAAYRRTVTELMERIATTQALGQHPLPTLSEPRSPQVGTDRPDPSSGLPPDKTDHTPVWNNVHATGLGSSRPLETVSDDTPCHHALAPAPPIGETATDPDVWPRAVALNTVARAATGNPVSVWRLRTDLRIGPRRARRIRERLLARDNDAPPAAD